jgi:tetratricopeptide (TPR) repeat protein
MILRLLALLCVTSLLFGYAPVPKVVTPAESEFETALEAAETDEAKVALAKEYLDQHPDNVPLGRAAQNILNRKSETPAEWYQERMDANPTSTNRYLWARASGDPEIMFEQASWIMENYAENFWGYYLAAVAEWSTEEPEMNKITGHFEQAVAKDPSRFEGFLWMGYAYEEAEKLDEALAAFDAAAIVDPESDSPVMAKVSIFAVQRNAESYFELVNGLLPDEPVTVELAVAQPDTDAKPVGFSGDMTVIESFTYW